MKSHMQEDLKVHESPCHPLILTWLLSDKLLFLPTDNLICIKLKCIYILFSLRFKKYKIYFKRVETSFYCLVLIYLYFKSLFYQQELQKGTLRN